MNKQELIGYAEQKVAYYESKARFSPEVREYAEGAISGIALLISEIKKLDEPQKVKVPQFVDEYLNFCMKIEISLAEAVKREIPSGFYGPYQDDFKFIVEAQEWLESSMNQNIFADAWLNGWEVEEEPRYKVIMPNPQSKNGNLLVLRRNQRGTITVNKVKANTARSGEGMDLTEKEIKSVDERYWPFAVPVEKV